MRQVGRTPATSRSLALCTVAHRYYRPLLALAFALAPVSGSPAQSSPCQFAVAGWLAVRVELQEARRAYLLCTRQHRTACTAEQGRVQQLEQQLKLLRNYVDGYCTR